MSAKVLATCHPTGLTDEYGGIDDGKLMLWRAVAGDKEVLVVTRA